MHGEQKKVAEGWWVCFDGQDESEEWQTKMRATQEERVHLKYDSYVRCPPLQPRITVTLDS